MTAFQEFIEKRIQRQISDAGLVVWYDPQGYYNDLINHLILIDTKLLSYDGSFFALRAAVEIYLDQPDPPKLLVYVPMEQTQTQHALVELESAGVILVPGATL